jgi:cyclin-dependent kinase 8/11
MKDHPIIDYYYKRGERVGSGTYGTVYFGTRKSDSRVVAIKETKNASDKGEDHRLPASIFRELVFLSEIDYPHIVRLQESNIFMDNANNTISMVYDFGVVDVRKMVHFYHNKNITVKPVIAKSVLFQLLLALDHLHKRSIAHCDVTPSNLLIMPLDNPLPGVVKLIDFGLSRVIDPDAQERQYGVVTVWYRAPELLLGDKTYTEKIDVWSAGCIFAELLTGNALFRSHAKEPESDSRKFNSQQLSHIMDVIGPLNTSDFSSITCDHIRAFQEMLGQADKTVYPGLRGKVSSAPASALDLLEKMLTPNPSKRISSSEALRHQYFNEGPLSVTNIAAEIPPDEWNELNFAGKHPSNDS